MSALSAAVLIQVFVFGMLAGAAVYGLVPDLLWWLRGFARDLRYRRLFGRWPSRRSRFPIVIPRAPPPPGSEP